MSYKELLADIMAKRSLSLDFVIPEPARPPNIPGLVTLPLGIDRVSAFQNQMNPPPTHIWPYVEDPVLRQTRHNIQQIEMYCPELPPTFSPELWYIRHGRPPLHMKSPLECLIDETPWEEDHRRFPLYTELDCTPIIRIPVYYITQPDIIDYLIDTPGMFSVGEKVYEPYGAGVGKIVEIVGYVMEFVKVRIDWRTPQPPDIFWDEDDEPTLIPKKPDDTFLVHASKMNLSPMEKSRSELHRVTGYLTNRATPTTYKPFYRPDSIDSHTPPRYYFDVESAPKLSSAVRVQVHMNAGLKWWTLRGYKQAGSGNQVHPFDLEARYSVGKEIAEEESLPMEWHNAFVDSFVD
jgi:hypothetical protein